MADAKKRAKLEKTGYIVSITIIVVCLAGITISSMWRLSEIRRQTTLLEEELSYWQGRLDDVEKEIREATKDETIERIARERLGLVMPGETVYMPKQSDVP
jgi:cell division protein FtsB